MARPELLPTEITLPLQYFGSVDYYARLAACRRVVIDDAARFDKRLKSAHRLTICDTHGIMNLTVPISKPADCGHHPLRWTDILVSRHGAWWHVVAETLASAYGRTPFFEFYVDRLKPFFSVSTPDEHPTVGQLCRASDMAVRAILGLDNEVVYSSDDNGNFGNCDRDVRNDNNDGNGKNGGISAARGTDAAKSLAIQPVEYYQVRADKFGFQPSMSILDLIFNMGPESLAVLAAMTGRLRSRQAT